MPNVVADVHEPYSMLTMIHEPQKPISAAAPVPFAPPRMTLQEDGLHAMPVHPREQHSHPQTSFGVQQQPTPAHMQLPISALGEQKLLELLRKQPESTININMSPTTSVALLERTDILSSNSAAYAKTNDSAAAYASSPVKPRVSFADPAASAESAVPDDYFKSTPGLYMVNRGLSLENEGKSVTNIPRALYDTGSEVNLMSEKFANAQKFSYALSGKCIATSLGASGSVVGEISVPLPCVLNKGTQHECKTFTKAATHFLVVRGVEHMYDVLLSTHCARDWGARPDPVTGLLEYRPFLVHGDKHTIASVPLSTKSARSWAQSLATGIFASFASTPSAGNGSNAPCTPPMSSLSSSVGLEAPDTKLRPWCGPLSTMQKRSFPWSQQLANGVHL
jgi:hypothetical protein